MTDYRTISVSELKPGSVLNMPIFDEELVLLLDAGACIDKHFVDRLAVLGINEVVVPSTAEQIVTAPEDYSAHGRAAAGFKDGDSVQRCRDCDMIIAIRPPSPNLRAIAWSCKSCGAIYYGSDDDGSESHGVVPTEPSVDHPFVPSAWCGMDSNGTSDPPEDLQRLVKLLVPDEYTGANRRRYTRHPVLIPLTTLPLAIDFRIDQVPVEMIAVNISLGGIALIHTRLVNVLYLAVDFSAAGIALLQCTLRVLHVRRVGFLYETAGEFMGGLTRKLD